MKRLKGRAETRRLISELREKRVEGGCGEEEKEKRKVLKIGLLTYTTDSATTQARKPRRPLQGMYNLRG